MRWKAGRNHRFKSLFQENADRLFFALVAEKIAAHGGQQHEQAIGGHFIVYPSLMGRMVLNASPQFDTAGLRILQDLSCIFHPHKIEQQIRREIAARRNHSLRKVGNLRCPSDCLVQFGHRVRIWFEAKRRSVCCADKTISHV